MASLSNIDPGITEEYLCRHPENLYLERKSVGGVGRNKLKPSKLASEIIGMLNADGGVIVLGLADDGGADDLNLIPHEQLLQYEKVCQNFISPAADVKLEKVNLQSGELIYLYHVGQNYENMYEQKDSHHVFKRVGDSNYGPLDNQEVDNLRHDKSLRRFEDQVVEDFDPNDIDIQTLQSYKDHLCYEGDLDDLLIKRNLALKKDGKMKYRNSAILLFSKDPDKYIPSSYVRYVRYEGSEQGVGRNYNVTKDERLEGNIPNLINKTKGFMTNALGDFYFLNMKTGRFERVPEYPEDAWLEGVVNALYHRSYNLQGNCVYIKHFDDRLEISNSGPLPAQVTVENIKEQRFSRNPRIGRVLFESGYVRELNEGVKRIFSSMAQSMLPTPIYKDDNDIVTLILENKVAHNRRAISAGVKDTISSNWTNYNDTEQKILSYIMRHSEPTMKEIAENIGVSVRYTRACVNKLVANGILDRLSEKTRDKNAKYVFKRI